MENNKIELLKEDIECVHKYLDDLNVPRFNNDKEYSIVGRIKQLQEHVQNEAVEFAEWVDSSLWKFNCIKQIWSNPLSSDLITTKELHKLKPKK